jgi:branched-chain amino acid transport system substrate-binding protein
MKKIFCLALGICLVALWGTAVSPVMAKEKEIKIGVIIPLSGGLAVTGKHLKAGYELAADVINHKCPGLGIPIGDWVGIPNLGGAKIKLIFKDHRSDPGLGADLAKRLILDEKVTGLMGCYNSSVTKTVSAVAERYGIPHLNGNSSSPLLTKRGLKWYWRTFPHDTFYVADLFKLFDGMVAGKAPGVKAIPREEVNNLAVATEDTEWGSATRELIEKFASQQGYKTVASFLYAHGAPDLTSETRRLVASKAGCYLFAPYVSDAILIVKTLKSMRAAPRLIWGQDAGFLVPDFYKTLGADVNGILTRTTFCSVLAEVKPIIGKINKMYKEKTGVDLTGNEAKSFTSLHAWAYVLNNARSTEPEALRKAFNALDIPGGELIMPWKGIKFGSPFPGDTHQNILGSGVIAQYQGYPDGKLEVIYPFELATADMIYPFPGWK